MNNTCSNCQFWKELDWILDDDESGIAGQCSAPMIYRGVYSRGEDKVKGEPQDMLPNGVLCDEHGGCSGMLATGPDFCCIHFTKKDQ